MNWKIVSAFAAGAVLASGIVYMAVKPGPAPKPVAIAALPAPAQIPVAPPPVATEPAVPLPPPPAPVHVRQKPSPMPPPARKDKPATVARNQVPAAQVPERPVEDVRPPAPAPQPPAEQSQAAPPPPVPPPPTPEPTPAPPVAAKPEEPARVTVESEGRTPHSVVLAAGTMLPVRIGEMISASRNQLGDSFVATLEQPLVIDGFIIAERGSRVEGKVVEATPAGRGGSASHLEIALVRLSTSDGQRIRIRTESYKKDGSGSSSGSDLAKIGAGAAIGAAIGAIAGGGKGAAIGAGAGAAAGTGAVLISNGKSAEIPVETRVTFRVQEPVTITEKLE